MLGERKRRRRGNDLRAHVPAQLLPHPVEDLFLWHQRFTLTGGVVSLNCCTTSSSVIVSLPRFSDG
jgi:hypothetical protein